MDHGLNASLLYTLGDLAKEARISRRILQHYANLGLLEPGALTYGGRKLYTSFAFDLIRDIRDLNQLGFSLEEIHKIMTLKKAIFHPDGSYKTGWQRQDISLTDEELMSMWSKTGEVLATIQRQERALKRFYNFLTKHFAPKEVADGVQSGPGNGGTAGAGEGLPGGSGHTQGEGSGGKP
ncbi:MerR family transcriptional regulator [Thermus thermamylovorans]|uniref:MerR family transcriptional regulator n=1 Tax=Thermus thermamylovorans TaxID=2509362 RepID=A0A4Q9B874_9DEIN|nr:MerR family transcriptional regulator [Thermus thermamylovorans]TBH21826.1 MerR family transcriptional regulator [Thermus thermamylovorans]